MAGLHAPMCCSSDENFSYHKEKTLESASRDRQIIQRPTKLNCDAVPAWVIYNAAGELSFKIIVQMNLINILLFHLYKSTDFFAVLNINDFSMKYSNIAPVINVDFLC